MILLGLQPFLCYNLIMSVLTAVGILLLSMLVLAVLQLVPGIFLLFSHFTRGKYSRVHANDLNIFFIIGVETAIVLVFLSLYAILCCSPAVSFIIDSDISCPVTYQLHFLLPFWSWHRIIYIPSDGQRY